MRTWIHLAAVVMSVGGLATGAWGQETGEKPGTEKPAVTSAPHIPLEVERALQSREFDQAVTAIDAQLAKPETEHPDYLLYLKGRALTELKRYDEAVAAFTAIEQDHAEGEWVSRARFGRADVFVRTRNYQAAGQVYKAEAERLLSRDRKDELAQIYLEFADLYFEGVPAKDPSQNKQPDYQQALTYYQQALQLGPTRPLRQRMEFRVARCFQELGNHGEAIAHYQRFIAEHGSDKTPDGERAPAEMQVAVRFQLGKTQLAAGQPVEARRTWEDLIAAWPGLAMDLDEEHGELLAQSRYLLAHTYGIPAPGNDVSLELGVAAARRFIAQHPDHKLAVQAELEIAQSQLARDRSPEAVATLEELIANPQYAGSDVIPQARFLLGSAFAAQKKFEEAIAAWREFLDEHPTDSRWSEVQRTIVDTEYAMAEEQREAGNYDAARTLWETFLNKYPLDARAPQILFHFGRMKYTAAVERHAERVKAAVDEGNSPQSVARDDEETALFEQAIEDWKRLVSKYPGTGEASHASFMIGLTLEDQLGRLEEALKAYKTVTGEQQSTAQQRINGLTSPQLEIVTERKFRSDEQPRVKVTTRNIETVTVKVYRIDMNDYFRKMHLASGVETLDIALIDPDEQFEHAVEGYDEYWRIEQDVEIPVDGAGVTAVTVSSDKLETTTMVVVSDLDIIAKTSRNELFLFAQNMRTGEPAVGASVLVSDGSEIFAEEVTGEDGVLQKSYEQLKSVEDLRIFAIHEGHAASTVNNLNGLDFAVGLAPRGYLHTDRPAYRAGQLVNIKGIVRWVDGDRFTFKAGEKYRLDVYDARSRVIHTQEVALNEFGTLSDNLILPEAAAQGQYRVLVHQPAGNQSYETSFQVLEYRLEPVELAIDLPRHVYYRGETVEGSITLKYYYGTPISGRDVQYQFGNEGWQTAQTDAEGKIAVSFETQDYAESQPVALQVSYPERGLTTAETVYLATRGFEIAAATLRDVYIDGETFDATFKVADAAGEPVATALKVEVFEETYVRGQRGERLVSQHEVTTDEENGDARQTLRLDEAGRYIVRATGIDRFENPVSGQTRITISGEKDEVRLRILADQHNYKVGDEATVRLHWREAPALALMTFEGASVLGYRLVELQNGANEVVVPMESQFAPNFNLSVAVMEHNRFHAASSEFRVSQQLQVTLKPSAEVLRPGDDLTVEIEVTDPQGRPLSAELSLSLVQSNLLAMFGDVQDAVNAFFGTGERTPSVRQATSCTFAYSPATREISQYLLAEEERLEILSREALALGELRKDLARRLSEVEQQLGAVPLANEKTMWEVLDDVELDSFDKPTSGGFGGGGYGMGANAPAASPMAGLEGQVADETRRWSYYWDDNGNGQPGEYDALLSLMVRQQSDFDTDGSIAVQPFFPTADLFADFLVTNQTHFNGVTADGRFIVVNGRGEAELQELIDSGLRLLPGMADAETAFWNPVIVTDETGQATVVIKLPERSTAWTLRGKGINAEALAGQAEAEIITRKDLFGELKLPLAFTDGDQAEVMVEVHSSLEGERQIAVTLKATIGDTSTEQTQTLDATGARVSELVFPVQVTAGENVAFELTVASGDDQRDVVQRATPIRPYGMPVYATASGSSAQSTLTFVDFDEGVAATAPSLEILVGPSIDRSLLDAVLGGGFTSLDRCFIPVSGIERSVSDILGGVALLEMIGQSRDAGTPESEALAGRISAAISQLVSSQRDDGAWSWSGRPANGEPDRFLSSRVVWALSAARDAGFVVEANSFNLAINWLQTAFTNSSATDRDGRAILLHGLAASGHADFAAANQLHRERNGLSQSGLVHAALVLIELDRNEMAAEILQLVKLPAADADAARRLSEIPWMHDPTELVALHLLALQAVDPANPQVAELVSRLQQGRVGLRWPVEKTNGPAIMALAQWRASTAHVAEKYTLTVFVNDRQVDEFTVDPAVDGSRRIAVPAELLAAEKPQRINFDMEGRGEFSYSAVLTANVPADQLKTNARNWQVSRRYEPAPRMLDGQPIPRGFSVLTGNYQWFANPLTQLPLGERSEVTLSPRRHNVTGAQDEQYDYLILTEPIPAGCTVLTDSISGDFERYEIGAGAITFYIGDTRYPGDIRYTLIGYLPGEYRVVPSVLRSFYDPQQIAVSSTAQLAVLERGQSSEDEYRLTPDELYHLGQRLLAKGDHAAAHEHLTQLFGNWRLGDDPYKQTVQMLFRTSLAAESNGEIVKYFEIIKEKYPEVAISFEDILHVAASYRELGEYERSYLVYRSTVQGSFERESQVAGFLSARGEFVRSVEVMEDLLRDYPAEPYVASATYGLAHEVYRKAPEAKDDAKLKEARLTRVDLIHAAIKMLDQFLTVWPKDPAADQASFALSNALLDLEQYQRAIDRSEEFAERYPSSRLLDSFWYIIGYSEFSLGHHEQALAMCRKVADAMFAVPETGGTREADNKWEAVYIMGQVYHSLNEPGNAIEQYERVKDRFSDADEAIEFFTRKEIRLDEVTTIKPGDAAHVELKFRNVSEAEIKVYRIDLMKFGLMQRNLDRITAINLAGIRPHHEETVELGDGKDYKDREQTVNLPMEDEGAYLVVCRGESLYASGLVLVSPLELEVQEDAVSGRVRVTVKDATSDTFAGDVHVKVIGSANDEFDAGDTDLRGLFIADDIRGTSTVIAMADEGRYAFYRGDTALQNVPTSEAAPAQEPAAAPMMGKEDALRQNLFDSNSMIQQQNSDSYRGLLNNTRDGIQAEEAY